MKKIFLLGTSVVALGALLPATSFAQTNSNDPETIIKDGEFFGEVRYRHESVDQDGFTQDANANTVRTNIGFKTGVYKDFQALAEAQIVQSVSDDNFNSTTNGQGTYPIVADPNVSEINELWLSWSGLPQTNVKVGRQKINIDNQRFVGTVNWRQNDQTFDAITLTNKSIDGLNLHYSYVGNVNRIQGGDNALGDLDSQVHLANISYAVADWLKLTGYGYWLDFDEAAANSSRTFGARATGKAAITDNWSFIYEAEVAQQHDHANNTANYDETYYHIAPGITGHGLTLKVGYEELGGDGTNSFRTPLATGHKFNGWADAFLTTPGAGLEDFYVSAVYKVSKTDTIFDGTKFIAAYHDYDSDASTTGDFGDELNLAVGRSFTLPDAGQPFKKLNVLLKYADYDGETAANADNDREKIWLQVGIKF